MKSVASLKERGKEKKEMCKETKEAYEEESQHIEDKWLKKVEEQKQDSRILEELTEKEIELIVEQS